MLVDITIAARFTIAARNGASTLGSDRANLARIERESSANRARPCDRPSPGQDRSVRVVIERNDRRTL